MQEQVLLTARPHWIYLAQPAVFMVFGFFCAFCTVATALAEPGPGQQPPPDGFINSMAFCSTCVFSLALVGVLVRFVFYLTTKFTLTNRRVIFEKGGLKTQTLEIFLGKVDTVVVETSALGQLLGYGNVVIRSGASDPMMLKTSDPQKIRHLIQEQISRF